MQHAFDADRGNRRALDRREQGAAECIANGGTEATFKWLG